MKSPKGKVGPAGGAGTPLSHPVTRISNGLRRPPLTQKKTAARPAGPMPSVGGARSQDRLHTRLSDLLAAEFAAYAQRGPTRKRLAARLGRTPEEIGKWLSQPGALAASAAHGPVAEDAKPTGAKPVGRARRPRQATDAESGVGLEPAQPPPGAERTAFLTIGTTIAISATMVGPGIAAMAFVDVNPVAQVEVI